MRILVALALTLLALPVRADDALPKAAAEEGFKAAECDVEFDEAYKEAESYDLGGEQKLFVLRCWRAAYQSGSVMFAVDKDGKARLLTFQAWNGKKYETVKTLSEADYDPNKKVIAHFHKGRGIGDCGSMGEWIWTGSEFKLSKYFFKEKCDGKPFDGRRQWQVFPRR